MGAKIERILLKLSGEVLAGEQHFGIEAKTLKRIADELRESHELGVAIGIVIGGGNFFRGASSAIDGIDRVSADYMGMLATVLNSIAMQNALEQMGVPTRLMSAISMNKICEPFIARRANRHLSKGRVVIFACGTGNPFFTTDTAAALRAKEIGADLIAKGTKVDGVYDSDPMRDSEAKFRKNLTSFDVLKGKIRVMDSTAISLCMEENIPIRVFNVNSPGNIVAVCRGDDVGSLVS